MGVSSTRLAPGDWRNARVARAIYPRKSRALRLDAGNDLLRQEKRIKTRKSPGQCRGFCLILDIASRISTSPDQSS